MSARHREAITELVDELGQVSFTDQGLGGFEAKEKRTHGPSARSRLTVVLLDRIHDSATSLLQVHARASRIGRALATDLCVLRRSTHRRKPPRATAMFVLCRRRDFDLPSDKEQRAFEPSWH
jgi:hypothetical protein